MMVQRLEAPKYVRDFGIRIHALYIRKRNGGHASARRLGLLHAVGEYIAFVNGNNFQRI